MNSKDKKISLEQCHQFERILLFLMKVLKIRWAQIEFKCVSNEPGKKGCSIFSDCGTTDCCLDCSKKEACRKKCKTKNKEKCPHRNIHKITF